MTNITILASMAVDTAQVLQFRLLMKVQEELKKAVDEVCKQYEVPHLYKGFWKEVKKQLLPLKGIKAPVLTYEDQKGTSEVLAGHILNSAFTKYLWGKQGVKLITAVEDLLAQELELDNPDPKHLQELPPDQGKG